MNKEEEIDHVDRVCTGETVLAASTFSVPSRSQVAISGLHLTLSTSGDVYMVMMKEVSDHGWGTLLRDGEIDSDDPFAIEYTDKPVPLILLKR